MKKPQKASIVIFVFLSLSLYYCGPVAGGFVLAPANSNSPYGYDPRIDLPKDLNMVNKPFLGLGIRYTKKHGALVSSIDPGPMEGTSERSPYCDRGDIVESIDGQPVSRGTLGKIMSSKKPGDTITIKFLRTNANVGTMLPTPGKDRNPSEAVITLGRMSEWTGPSSDVLEGSDLPDLDKVIPDAPVEPPAEEFLAENLRKQRSQAPIQKLKKAFWEIFCRPSYSRNMLPQAAYAFKYPFRQVELQNAIMQPVKKLPEDPTLERGTLFTF